MKSKQLGNSPKNSILNRGWSEMKLTPILVCIFRLIHSIPLWLFVEQRQSVYTGIEIIKVNNIKTVSICQWQVFPNLRTCASRCNSLGCTIVPYICRNVVENENSTSDSINVGAWRGRIVGDYNHHHNNSYGGGGDTSSVHSSLRGEDWAKDLAASLALARVGELLRSIDVFYTWYSFVFVLLVANKPTCESIKSTF